MDFQTTIANLTLSYNEDELIPVIEQQKSTDTWAPAINSPIDRPFQDEHLDSLTFQRYFDTEKIVNTASHPKFKCKIIDQSPHGCCLELPNAALFSLTVNELISFRSEIYSTHWQVGIISWFKVMENETVQVGIHLLSTKAIPLGIEIPFSYGSNKNCIEAILLPYENSLKTHSSILVKEKYINENEVVKVLQKGLVKDLKISDQIHKSEHYNHFNCGIYIDEKK